MQTSLYSVVIIICHYYDYRIKSGNVHRIDFNKTTFRFSPISLDEVSPQAKL